MYGGQCNNNSRCSAADGVGRGLWLQPIQSQIRPELLQSLRSDAQSALWFGALGGHSGLRFKTSHIQGLRRAVPKLHGIRRRHDRSSLLSGYRWGRYRRRSRLHSRQNTAALDQRRREGPAAIKPCLHSPAIAWMRMARLSKLRTSAELVEQFRQALFLQMGCLVQFDKNDFRLHNIDVVGSALQSCLVTKSPDLWPRFGTIHLTKILY